MQITCRFVTGFVDFEGPSEALILAFFAGVSSPIIEIFRFRDDLRGEDDG
jgi:hypothetical protein